MKIAILGGGESGVGAALLAKKLGFTAFVSDFGKIGTAYTAELEKENIEYEDGTHTESRILECDLVVKSPGIPEKAPILKKIKAHGIETIGEIEFAFRHKLKNARIIGITGSNGKTTTTMLLYHLLSTADTNVFMGGNVGKSFARLVAEHLNSEEKPLYVLELSSFQLDDNLRFRANTGILLNITPDHLDRYEYKMENYVASKFQISDNQKTTDFLIINADDAETTSFIKRNPNFTKSKLRKAKSSFYKKEKLKVSGHVFDMSKSALQGPHNMFNAACALWASLLEKANPAALQEGLNTFKTPQHRLEVVAEINEVLWVNDSKATNVDSVYYALKAMNRPIVWIVGGQDKGNDYASLMEDVEHKVTEIVCLGVDNEPIKKAFAHLGKPLYETKSAKEAVEQAQKRAKNGDVVLLSPACASFDLFKNYIHRGDLFKEEVLKLIKR